MIYILGGISLDFIFTKDNFLKGTSNPSFFTYRVGGVGYNIYNFLEIKEKIFLTTIGKDPFGKMILDTIKNDKKVKIIIDNYKENNKNVNFKEKITNENIRKNKKLKIEKNPFIYFMISKKYPTSIYNVLMEKGNCYIATADFRSIEENITFSKLSFLFENIKSSDIVVLDSNIEPAELEKIILNLSNNNCKIFFETISFEKAKRARDILNSIFFTSPDILEFNALIEGSASVFDYMEKHNIEYILRTEGSSGSTLFRKKDKETIHYKPKKVLNLKDTTGAGDFLFSKIVQFFYKGKSIEESIEMATDEVIEYLIKTNENLH